MVYPFKISCTFRNNKSIFIMLLFSHSLLPFFTVRWFMASSVHHYDNTDCCRISEKLAFEGPKRGLSVTDTPAGVPAPVLFASAIENSFRRLTTATKERTMRDDRSNEWFHRFSFTQVLAFIIVGTRVSCSLDDPPHIEGSIEAGYVRLNLPTGQHHVPTVSWRR